MSGKGFLGNMTENLQADCVQSRQAGFMQCFLMIMSLHGKMAGVSRQTISLIERGDYSPSVTLALKLAKICEVKVEDIFQ